MKRKKVLELLLLSALSCSMLVTPAGALTTSSSLDSSLQGSLTLHKIIENDGQSTVADGLVNDAENRTAVADVEFSYKKIADITEVDEDGTIGVYYTNIDESFLSLLKEMHITLESTRIGNSDYYTITAMETAVNAVNRAEGDGSTYTGQTKLTDYIATGTAMAMTDSKGETAAENMDLGLYLVGETDISAHDGLDANGNPINTSPNPEAPIIESPADPFLIAIPMTNTGTVDGHEPGTVWQYDVDVYPKDQTNSITKKIVDPDAKDEGLLRDQEDYQIGDSISQVIYADAPKLQPGNTHKSYQISDEMTEGLTFEAVTRVAYGANISAPDKSSDFDSFTDLTAEDYTVTVDDDQHGFSVTLTESGLEKLDGLTANGRVVVFFDSTLNSNAKIGTLPENENHPTLTWRNSNTLEKSYEGNHVYDYTYELDILKRGVSDASLVEFTLSRDEDTLDLIKEADGTYHIFDNTNDNEADIVSVISPTSDGHLYIKGLDSEAYVLTETKTEPGKNLLSSPIQVSFSAADPDRDGNLTKAEIVVGTSTAELEHTNGIAQMTVDNRDSITLKTGGSGMNGIYVAAASLLCVTGAGYLVLCKKRKKAE